MTRASVPVQLGFTLLGTVTATADGREVDLGSPQQRAVLAILLLARGRPVPADEIVARIWSDDPPRSADGTLRTYLYRLRKVFAPLEVSTGFRIETLRGAHRAVVGSARIDAVVAESAHRTARRLLAAGADEAAAVLLTDALALWTAAPLAGLPGDRFDDERARLDDLRDECSLDLAGALVRTGRAVEAVPVLRGLVAARPLDERVAAGLLEALRCAGRRSDAFAAYDDVRHRLADELGVAPGEALQAGLRRLLADPGPEVGHRVAEQGVVASGDVAAGPAGRRGARAVPAQLPGDLPEFVGRGRELATVGRMVAADGGARVLGVTGLGGTGKTAFAVHAARGVGDRFPDGQFFVELHGSGGRPRRPAEVLRTLLLDAGVPRPDVPTGVDARAAAWRTLTAGLRVLVVLDDAVDAAQVVPLLPTGPGTLTIVTGTRRLVDVPGARWTTLGPLAPDESVDLMGRLVGHDRLAAEPAASARLVAACSHQPLAVRVAAARLEARPTWTVAQIEQQLYDDLDRPVVMHADCAVVDEPFRRADATLGPPVRDAFHRLSHLREERFSVSEAARALRCDDGWALGVLEDLVDAHLLVEYPGTRFGFFALVRAWARRQPVTGPAAISLPVTSDGRRAARAG